MNKSNSWKSLNDTFRDSGTTPPRRICLTSVNPSRLKHKLQPLPITKKYVHSNKASQNKENDTRSLKITRHSESIGRSRPSTMVTNENICDSSDSDGVIFHDPDYDDVVVASTTPTSRNIPLSIFTRSKSNSEQTATNANWPKSSVAAMTRTTMKKTGTNFRAIFSQRVTTAEQKQLEDSIIDSDDEDLAEKSFDLKRTKTATMNLRRFVAVTKDCSSEPSISSGSSIQCSSPADVFIDTQSSGLSIVDYQLPKSHQPEYSTKRKKIKSGGLVEQLRNSISRRKSNTAFWIYERQTNLIKCGEKVCITDIENQYGQTLLHCICSNGDKRIVCLNTDSKKRPMPHVGMSMEIEFDTSGYQLGEAIAYPNAYKLLL